MAINRASVSEQVEKPPMDNKKSKSIPVPKRRPKNRKLAQMKADAKKAGRVVGKSLTLPLKGLESYITGDSKSIVDALNSLYDEKDKMAKGGKVGSKKKSTSSKKKTSGHNRLY